MRPPGQLIQLSLTRLTAGVIMADVWYASRSCRCPLTCQSQSNGEGPPPGRECFAPRA
ncbi:hypothetical protein PF003_g31023 [Phytophthora fragariae]|nr:hypothetical protein PF003_g31023 [Phytophthora fragariae]